MKALCIIPEGRYTKECKSRGYPYQVSCIPHLDEILSYASRNDLGVLYLSHSAGIVYSDDEIEYSKTPATKYSKDDWEKWSQIISEEIVRHCISFSVSRVYLMCKSKFVYKRLIQILQSRGVEVITPIMGYTESMIRQRLLL